jgi:hypothetical protein
LARAWQWRSAVGVTKGASIYTTNQGVNYGAQFITFNVDGNPKKARCARRRLKVVSAV